MKNIIAPFDWRIDLDGVAEADSIGNDFILLDNPIIIPNFDTPFKADMVTTIICLKGTMKGLINMKSQTTQAPCLAVILPDQLLQYEYISEDFSGLFIVMSKEFTDSLNIPDKLPLRLSVRNNPFISLNENELDVITNFYAMLQKVVRIKDNPYRLEIVKNLTTAFFYALGYQYHKIEEVEKKSKQEVLVDNFIKLTQKHYREQRGIEFYANLMCLTPKYLSKVVKENTSLSASEWIDHLVILEAKALLKTSNLTIQQVSDKLNFPSQSFFGKYFKRHSGISPKEYKH
jgi:AraC family transcriptional regulator, transcriptional activator of pobA